MGRSFTVCCAVSLSVHPVCASQVGKLSKNKKKKLKRKAKRQQRLLDERLVDIQVKELVQSAVGGAAAGVCVWGEGE